MWAFPAHLCAEEQPPATVQDEGAKGADVVTVTILNTGDMHEMSGNLVRIAGYVKQWKAKNPNTLLIDAGDFMNDRDPTRGSTPGEQMMAIMAAVGYDVCILGNHDYKLGKDWILEKSQKYPKFPLVLCNMKWDDKDKERAKDIPRYKIFQFQGVRVAVIGSGSHYTNHQHGPAFPMYHEREAYLELADEVRGKADVIVFISHVFERSDNSLLGAWGEKGPDVLIGAHSHKRFAQRSGKTLIVKAGYAASHLGVATIKWNTREKKIVSCNGGSIAVSGNWPEDEEVKALREKFLNPQKGQKPPAQGAKEKAQAAGSGVYAIAAMLGTLSLLMFLRRSFVSGRRP
jgi:2',3'-cyclic-nucleotide 2'-phosphodiesterase (5'-nucleotidase family)